MTKMEKRLVTIPPQIMECASQMVDDGQAITITEALRILMREGMKRTREGS
jgi:hypothetical protein